MATRFKLFGQSPFGLEWPRPEIVEVSTPDADIGPGPSDSRMYVVEPVGKSRPYGRIGNSAKVDTVYLPPWRSRVRVPVAPDERGGFDYLEPGDPGFEAAHAFGSIRFTLDVWEKHLGAPIDWHFADHFDRLEISILPEWDNAHYGYGFLEIGSQFEPDGSRLSFALDFDVIAHEAGHAILYSFLGLPDSGTELPEYGGFQESFSDLVSLIAVMHFPSVLQEVLGETRGNLYAANHLSRFSEFSSTRQIRSSSNKRTMYEFAQSHANEHELSQPLTGAFFDILIDLFHRNLVQAGWIEPELDELSDISEFSGASLAVLQEQFNAAYEGNEEHFYRELVRSRDQVATYIAAAITLLKPNYLDYGAVLEALLTADRIAEGGRYANIISTNFARRGLGIVQVGPRRVFRERRGRNRERNQSFGVMRRRQNVGILI